MILERVLKSRDFITLKVRGFRRITYRVRVQPRRVRSVFNADTAGTLDQLLRAVYSLWILKYLVHEACLSKRYLLSAVLDG
jgi:hypothetical protein